MIERQIESPIPMPLDFVVKKVSNSRPAFSVEIPTPQSVTLTCTCCASDRALRDSTVSIPRFYGNYTYRLLENFVPRRDQWVRLSQISSSNAEGDLDGYHSVAWRKKYGRGEKR
jgi:hypothetical protein